MPNDPGSSQELANAVCAFSNLFLPYLLFINPSSSSIVSHLSQYISSICSNFEQVFVGKSANSFETYNFPVRGFEVYDGPIR